MAEERRGGSDGGGTTASIQGRRMVVKLEEPAMTRSSEVKR